MGDLVKYRVSGIPQELDRDAVRDELEKITGLRLADCYYIAKSKFEDAVDTIAFVKVHTNEVDDLRKLEGQQLLGNSRDCRLKEMDMDNRGGGGGGGGGGGFGGGGGDRRPKVDYNRGGGGGFGGGGNSTLSPMSGRPEVALCIAMQDSSGQKTWSPLSPAIQLDDAAISKLTVSGGGSAVNGGGGSNNSPSAFSFGNKPRDEPDGATKNGFSDGGGFGFKSKANITAAAPSDWNTTTPDTTKPMENGTAEPAVAAEQKKEEPPVASPAASVPVSSSAGGGVKIPAASVATNAWISGIAAWVEPDTANVYIQVVDQAQVLAYTENLKAAPQKKVDLSRLEVGQCISAIFLGDPYRARVTKKEGNNKFTVLFVDWGNSEEKNGDDFMELSGDMAAKPAACVCVNTLSTISGSKLTGETLKTLSKALKKGCNEKKVDFKKLSDNTDGTFTGIIALDQNNVVARAVHGDEFDKNVVMNGHVGQIFDKSLFKGGDFLACGFETVDNGRLILGYPTGGDGLNGNVLTYVNDNLPQDLANKSKDAKQRFVLDQVVVCDGTTGKARGFITKIVGEDQVEVLLIDWGTKKTVPVSSLRVCAREEQCMQAGRACMPLTVTTGGNGIQQDGAFKANLTEWKKMPDQTDFITCTAATA